MCVQRSTVSVLIIIIITLKINEVRKPIIEFQFSQFKLCYQSVPSEVGKANGEHKRNVWGIVQCPGYVLKCNKSVNYRPIRLYGDC